MSLLCSVVVLTEPWILPHVAAGKRDLVVHRTAVLYRNNAEAQELKLFVNKGFGLSK